MADSPYLARRRVRLAIRSAREAKGLTQGEVAEAMEWSLSTVTRNESGEMTIPAHGAVLCRESDTIDGTVEGEQKIRRHRETFDLLWHRALDERESVPFSQGGVA